MGNSSCRYIVNAVGKDGETYYTHCQDKQALKKWIDDHQEKLLIDELKITDKNQNPFLKLFSRKR
ncbi:hypothetical protein D0469_13945 [Peribacillus saganii]|uniref:Uncharacterized protein n=1 Tax=Peribacillus saganii TaxID=2303992 RepID=A0A372LLB8_9BACI|nr:hypothetical protein [Peribacillus saganii]RFU67645.1 hypothetical protein D0469_13945 [Peribacillus saganii]